LNPTLKQRKRSESLELKARSGKAKGFLVSKFSVGPQLSLFYPKEIFINSSATFRKYRIQDEKQHHDYCVSKAFFVRQHNHFRLTECEFGSGVTVDDSVGSRLAARGKFFPYRWIVGGKYFPSLWEKHVLKQRTSSWINR
jgi:hypothetical protein